MKRSLSTALVITMLMTLFSGITIVSANETSTLKEIFSFDMSDDYADFVTRYKLYHSSDMGSQVTPSDSNIGNIYGIGDYYSCVSGVYIPLGTTKNANGQIDGVKKTGAPNQYIEAEFDYAVRDHYSGEFGAVGATLLTYSSATSTTLLDAADNYGSFYHRYYSDGTVKFFRTNGGSEITTDVKPTIKKWYRIKLISQLTDETGAFKSSGNATHVYIDGVPVASYAYKSKAVSNANEYISFLRFHQSNGRCWIDNISVRTYQAGDAPVEKGALVAAIRNFEEKYTTYTDYAEAVTLINAAKVTYESSTAEDTDVTAALANIEAAENIVNPKPLTYFSYDFETDANVQAFEDNSTSASTSVMTDSNYNIGKYLLVKSGHPYINISPAISRAASENIYLEAEFDLLPVEPTLAQLGDGTRGNKAAVYFSSTSNQSTPMAGIECNYNISTNKECLTEAYVESNKLKSFKYGQWSRCKVVCLLNDNGSTDNKAGLVKYYIDGNLVGSLDYNKNNDTIDYLRLYSNYSYIGVDNLSVRTYTADNPAPEKDVLVSKIRDFIKNYPEYTENAEALALFNQAEAVYNNQDAEPADITTALGYLTQAERKLFNAEPLIRENFDGSPMYFFDTVAGTSYTSSATALPTGASYADDDTYLVTTALKLSAAAAVKNFNSVALGTDAATKYVTAECDINTAGEVTVALSDSVKYTLTGNSTWTRVRFDINTVAKTYDVYVNGDKKVTGAAISESALSSLTVTGASELMLDNVTVYGFENTADIVSDKGALVTALRASKALLDADTMTEDETALMTKIFDKYAVVNERPSAAKADIDTAASKVAFYNTNLSAQMEDAISVVIPGVGKELTDTIANINLHHGEQAGLAEWDEVFFDGEGSTDFSDVRFYNTDGLELPSNIESSGNYDFLQDSSLVAGTYTYSTSDGHLIVKKDGMVKISKDRGETWSAVGSGYRTSNVVFVDRDDNIYHFRENDPDYGPCVLFKLSASDDYATEKMVIDSSDLYGLYNNYDKNNVIEDYDVTSAHFTISGNMQDDDGYIYVGRYQQEWTGAALFVSDSSGENFRLVDFRPDKQHVHSISINYNVYPNEVYVCYDDSFSQPLCYVSTDHFGYDEIKDNPIHQLPTVARSTGGREKFKSIQDGDLYQTTLMPKNQETADIMAHARKHSTQVPIPFGNSDYFRHFALKESREDAPDKFEYNEEMGKWYTKKNKEYYNELGGFTHYYSDNIYALGCGEANILGGPGAYKTTDIMDPLKYYPVIKTTEGARRVISPADGVLLCSALSGGYAQQAQIYLSYDDGETWDVAYTTGYDYSTDAGNGHGRYVSTPWEKADGSKEVVIGGYGIDVALRATFGGDNYFGLSSVKIPTLPEDGLKIFLKQDGAAKKAVTTYYYGTINGDTPAIRSSKTASGEGDALTFPLTGTGKDMIYTFDIDTEADTAIEAALTASTRKGNEAVATALFDTTSGSVTLNGVKAAESIEAVKNGSFTTKILTDASGKAKLYVDDVFVCEAMLAYEYVSLAQLSFDTKDVSGTAPTLANPVEVFYSNVGYGEYSTDTGQYLLEGVTLKNTNNETVDTLAKDVTIAKATISKVDMDIDGGKLFACIYDSDEGYLVDCTIVDVTGSGTYDINLTSDRDDAVMKFFLVKDLKTLVPVTLTNLIEEAVQ